MLYIFVLKNPNTLEHHQFELDDTIDVRHGLFARLNSLGFTGSFPCKVVTNYGTKVWMIQHKCTEVFKWNDEVYNDVLALTNAGISEFTLVDESLDVEIGMPSFDSSEFLFKLLKSGFKVTMDEVPITWEEKHSYSIVYEI